jgi:ABC-2 type transport system permease protein
LLSLGLGVFGAMLYFLLLSTIELTAFWADNVWSLQVMLRFTVQILGGVLLPLSWYPELVQSFLQYTPFPHLFYAPVQGLLGLKTPEELLPSFLNLALWSLVTVVLFRLVWRRGLKSYAGVGI